MAKQNLEGDETALCISGEKHSKQRGWQLPSPLGTGMLKTPRRWNEVRMRTTGKKIREMMAVGVVVS